MQSDVLAALNAERARRKACVLVTDLATGAQRLVRADAVAADPLADDIQDRLRLGKSGRAGPDDMTFFLVLTPPVRLVVLGAGHISQALAPMAKLAGFDVIIIDPRTAFAAPERFPNCTVIADWPQDILPGVGLDSYTAVAVLAHEPRIDDPGIAAALANSCFYIGALGSRKTHAKRVERLSANGIDASSLDTIHAPIGVDIGAVSPAEIAVSILAEIISARQQKPRRPV